MNTHVSNRLESLVLDIGQSLNNHHSLHSEDEKQSELLYEDEDDYTKQYDSVQELILSEDNLIGIVRHPLFQQCRDRELHTTIYRLVLNKADDHSLSVSLATLQIMCELQSNTNFMTSLASVISQTLKWTRKIKELRSKRKPQQRQQQQQQQPQPRHEAQDTTSEEEESSSCAYAAEQFNPPQHETSSDESSSSSCFYSEPEAKLNVPLPHAPKIKANSPTKPPIKEGTYASINHAYNHNQNQQNKKNKKRNKRRKRRKKLAAQNRKNNTEPEPEPEPEPFQNIENENVSREYSHNFDQFSSGDESLSDIALDPKCNYNAITPKADTPVPPNKKRCAHCTFHNLLQCKKCTMCGNTFKDSSGQNAPKHVQKKRKKKSECDNNNNWNHESNIKKKGRKRRKPRFWLCNACGEKNKNLTGKCKCGKEKELEAYEWKCACCTTTNHASIAKCKSCGEKRTFPDGKWQCIGCYAQNEAHHSRCAQCHKPKPSVGAAAKNKNKKKKKAKKETNANVHCNEPYAAAQYPYERAPDRGGYNNGRARAYNNNNNNNNAGYGANRRQYQPKSRGPHQEYHGGSYYRHRGSGGGGPYYPRNEDRRQYAPQRGRGRGQGQWTRKVEVGRYRRKPQVQVPLNNQEQFKTDDNLSHQYMQQQPPQQYAPRGNAAPSHEENHYGAPQQSSHQYHKRYPPPLSHHCEQTAQKNQYIENNYNDNGNNNNNNNNYNDNNGSKCDANGPRIPPVSHKKENMQTPPPKQQDNEEYGFYGPQRDQQRNDNEATTPPPQNHACANPISLNISSIF